MLRLAIQRSGRLSEDSRLLISEAGIHLERHDRKLRSEADNFPLECLFVRDDDIPEYVQDGVADCGIVGENMILERGSCVSIVERLGFSKCRLSLAVANDSVVKNLEDLAGKIIATSYPRSLQHFLEQRGVSAIIREIKGSTELAPGIGLADAICDLVSSGSTLLSNRLREVETLFRSEAVLISSAELEEDKERLLNRLIFQVRAVMRARTNKYILMNVPNNRLEEVVALLPGLKSPTIVPLADEGWSSVHSVINEDHFWEIIEKIKDSGAEGILVCPIEKMIV